MGKMPFDSLLFGWLRWHFVLFMPFHIHLGHCLVPVAFAGRCVPLWSGDLCLYASRIKRELKG